MSIVFTVSGTSGSGVSQIVRRACQELDHLQLALQYTTRKPQIADSPDNGFFFTTREAFERMIEREEFLEYACVFGNYYGTPKSYIQKSRENGNNLIVQVDEGGVAQIKQKVSDAVSILIIPGQVTRGEHTRGLKAGSNASRLSERLFLASQLPRTIDFDHIVVSDRLEDSINKFIEIIRAERLKRS
jgi:guanylate kinase